VDVQSARTENGRDHRVYLTQTALDELARVPKVDKEPRVFRGYLGIRQQSEQNATVFANVGRREKPRHALRDTLHRDDVQTVVDLRLTIKETRAEPLAAVILPAGTLVSTCRPAQAGRGGTVAKTNLKSFTIVATFLSPGVTKGAGGFAIVGGKIVKIPPRGPAFQQLADAAAKLAKIG